MQRGEEAAVVGRKKEEKKRKIVERQKAKEELETKARTKKRERRNWTPPRVYP